MTINEIINTFNKYLESERKYKDIRTSGHFVLKTSEEKKLGNYRKYSYELFFINKEMKPFVVITLNQIFPVIIGHEDLIHEKMDEQLLMGLFELLSLHVDKMQHFILGDYGIK